MTITFLLQKYNSSGSEGEETELRDDLGQGDCINNTGKK